MAETHPTPAELAEHISRHPGDPALRFAYAQTLLADNDFSGAEAALKACVRLNPRHDQAWQQLNKLAKARGDMPAQVHAARHANAIHATAGALRTAMMEKRQRRPAAAEQILRQLHHQFPEDAVTLRLLADLCECSGRSDEAEALVAEALHVWPDCDSTEHHLAILYYRHNKLGEANTLLSRLRQKDPGNPAYQTLSAQVESQLGQADRAAGRLETLLTTRPEQPELWRSLGHIRKMQGRTEDATSAYRRAWQLRPGFASVTWAMADLKTFHFTDEEVSRLQEMQKIHLPRTEACALHFALGKALSDAGDYAAGFQHYAKGNALRRAGTPYNADKNHQLCEELAAMPAARPPTHTTDGPTPIFIVGLPRTGSTLLEQMLASHSAIEGTMELPDMPMLAHRLCGRDVKLVGTYAEKVKSLTAEKAAATGAEYLRRTEIQRTAGKPFFIDKRPDNFFHIPLIVRALPKAKIIDMRRHPMACGFSCFSQLFAGGHAFSYDLESIGRYYCDYVRLMHAFDAIIPGKILHISYENLITDTATELKRILNFCGLEYEADCLSFYENRRAVRTASAAQVRQPLYKSGLKYWQNFAKFLSPLQTTLGPTQDRWQA